eukprot:486079_1
MALDAKADTDRNYAIVSAIVYNTFGVINGTLLIVHTYNTISDLCTKERKAVSSRRTKPTIDTKYKSLVICTYLAVFFMTAATITGVTNHFATIDLHCDIPITGLICCIQFSKSWMFTVFCLRLYSIYDQSAFRYSSKCILFFLILIWCYGIMAISITIYLVESINFDYGHPNYPNWCGSADESIYAIIGALTTIQDLIAAVGFLFAFWRPLRSTFKTMQASDGLSGGTNKTQRKILYAGTKTTILTLVATFSTLLFLTLTASMSGIFSIPDQTINNVCLLLMTAYYPDKKYYQKICCWCIKCCDKRKTENEKYEETEMSKKTDIEQTVDLSSKDVTQTGSSGTVATSVPSNTNTNTQTKSIDTMSQLKVTGAQMNNNNDIHDRDQLDITPEPQEQV